MQSFRSNFLCGIYFFSQASRQTPSRSSPVYYVRWSVPAVTAVWLLDCVRQVAKALNADMILVANGGLGSAYDELELNRGICEKYGIKVRGVVLNKVV